MIKLMYLDVNKVNPSHFYELLQTIPEHFCNEIKKIRSFNDQKHKLFGKLIVKSFHLRHTAFFDWSNWDQDTRGKPFIADGKPFNISHSGDLVLVAFSLRDVGIDIELMRGIDIDAISNHLHRQELSYIQSAKEKLKAFYHVWTRKEAFLKATGEGIGDALDKKNCLETRVASDGNWFIRSLPFIPDYRLAVCSPIEHCPVLLDEVKLDEIVF